MKFFLSTLIFFALTCHLYADAYLSEDRIYYSADSYKIDYENEVIYANGHATFRKEDKVVNADRIIIYYAQGQKWAQLFKNVVVLNKIDNNSISGDYGEVFFNEDSYTIKGNTVYADKEIKITSDSISTFKGEESTFSGGVQYTDRNYEITAPVLSIVNDIATFKNESVALHIESGDRIHCDSISFNTNTGDAVFHEQVLYVQEEAEEGDPLLLRSDTVRYFQESDTYIFLGNVFVLNRDFAVQSAIARYIRDAGILKASGNIVLQENEKYTYCNNANYDENTGKTVLYNKVNGILFNIGD